MPSRARLLEEMRDWLRDEHGVVVLGPLGFENAYALAMRRDRAAALGVRTIERPRARTRATLRIGGDFEFFVRPEWEALRDGYGLRFASARQFQSTFMYQAVVERRGRRDLGVLERRAHRGGRSRRAGGPAAARSCPTTPIILLVAAARGRPAAAARARAADRQPFPIELMREANYSVDRDVDKAPAGEAARWLAAQVPSLR